MVTAVQPRAGRPVDHYACPACRGKLLDAPGAFSCAACDRVYPVVDGIPILLEEGIHEAHDELEHLVDRSANGHKRAQAAFFDDESAAEFEITRPHGTPALYGWLLSEKLRRATLGIESMIRGRDVLVICGGSGLDAEFYARMGARVVSSDISLGAARRTAERARRYGLDITPIVADAESLPFQDRSMDVVAVHDGLHHLERPEPSLDEMARVAGAAVSVTEPANAAITKLAVKLGLALDREEAGNRVGRLDPADVSVRLGTQGFRMIRADRYLMYYRHVPGAITRLLSRPLILPLMLASIRALNWIAGRFGNKMVVIATREELGIGRLG
jgi:SAM-dependent methyltransferase